MNEQKQMQRYHSLRRIAALVMLGLFVLLILNLLFFHVLAGESAVLYIGLIVVFFLGNGMRGGAHQHGEMEKGSSGDEFGEGPEDELGEGPEDELGEGPEDECREGFGDEFGEGSGDEFEQGSGDEPGTR